MIPLVLAAIFFVGIHFVISGSRLRDTLVARLGESRFRAGFGLLSLLGLVWLAQAYRAAPYIETWGQLGWFKPVALLLILPAFVFATLGMTTANPTAVGGAAPMEQTAQGVLRITRHPFLWGVALWAATHLIANGDAASLVLFGALLLLAVGGTYSIDDKRLRLYGEAWEKYLLATSNLPFLAIIQRRNILALKEIGWRRPALALVLYLAMLHFHKGLFGVSPLF
ncbi:Uncharacterized membrane protein [Methylomagnum ishizawai]|uniref:Uncharacterized membrane protein n=1 Tax=Methylomagnum ishizawai TaxID=1760988 RepID=A0A1Y6CXZ8_9GAMM|nr:NnrU family protein [Methylomagnum ishizawai]SMF95539.1 Uncharacterized membrane protein [Methylomagnum ishizawai]